MSLRCRALASINHVLKKGFHHVPHLDEENGDLLVVISALYVKLHDDSESPDGDYSDSLVSVNSNTHAGRTSNEWMEFRDFVQCLDESWKAVDKRIDTFTNDLHRVALVDCLQWRLIALGCSYIRLYTRKHVACTPF